MKSYKIFLSIFLMMSISLTTLAQNQSIKSTTGKLIPYGRIDTLTTFNATPVIMDTYTISNNTSGIIEVTVAGSTAAGVGATGKLIYRYTKASGTLTIATADTASAVTVDGGLSGAGFALAVDGSNNAKLTITGKASTTIKWRSVMVQYKNWN